VITTGLPSTIWVTTAGPDAVPQAVKMTAATASNPAIFQMRLCIFFLLKDVHAGTNTKVDV
jgi:hypothetical protein